MFCIADMQYQVIVRKTNFQKIDFIDRYKNI